MLSRSMLRIDWKALLAVAALLLAPAAARADGAFPDATQVLLPEDAPHRVYLGTNFGVLVSDDDGLHWSLSCEAAIGTGGMFYQLGWAQGQLFGATLDGVATSADGACGWTTSATQGFVAPSDVFADRAGRRVFALARPPGPEGTTPPMALWISTDAAATFAPLYQAPADAFLLGVESAQSRPVRVYTAELQYDPAAHPYLLRSDDSGASWTRFDLKPVVGEQAVRIAAVDPADPDRLFLRSSASNATDSLLISEDGGATVRVAKALSFSMTAFLLRANGDLLITTNLGEAWVSHDRGATFERHAWPHVRGLGERDGLLYAATANTQDGFALATSDDGGRTWLPVMDLRHLCGVLACGALPSTCAEAWTTLSTTLGIKPDACDNLPARTPWVPPPSSSCGGCGAAGGPLAMAGALAWAMLRPRRRRR
ncbi:MAG TPA: hypothetical protein VND93_03535 [Myxococcales bacterium]|nr:hypothetical protein [Myxococcales bacterium]